MSKLSIDMHYFNDLKNMSVEELIELRDNPRPMGAEDDEINLWIGRKTGNWEEHYSDLETTFMAHGKARRGSIDKTREKEFELFQF